MHPHHARYALYLLGFEPQEGSTFAEQLRVAHSSVGRECHIEDEQSIAERGYCFGQLALPVEDADHYSHADTYRQFHALGMQSRNSVAPESAMTVTGQATQTRRLTVPIAFGRGSDTAWIPAGVALDLVQETVVRLRPDGTPFPDGSRYALCRWAGCYVIVGHPDTRFEPLDALKRGIDRWQVLRELFEQDKPGVWAKDDELLALAQQQIDGIHLRDIRTARTMYRRGELGQVLPWVLARIERLGEYRKGKLTEAMRRETEAVVTSETPIVTSETSPATNEAASATTPPATGKVTPPATIQLSLF